MKSEATGQARKEAQRINCSLSCRGVLAQGPEPVRFWIGAKRYAAVGAGGVRVPAGHDRADRGLELRHVRARLRLPELPAQLGDRAERLREVLHRLRHVPRPRRQPEGAPPRPPARPVHARSRPHSHLTPPHRFRRSPRSCWSAATRRRTTSGTGRMRH